MEKAQDISRKLSGKRIILPILLGLIAATWLLYSNLTTPVYQVFPGGGFEWVDGNGNGKVDVDDPIDFQAVEVGGEYEQFVPWDRLESVSWSDYAGIWLLLSLCMVVLRDLGYMVRIRILSDYQLSWRQSFDCIMLWEFSSALTPSVVGGSGIAVFILNREGIRLGRSTAIVMVTALLDELFYIVMVPLVFVLVPSALLFPDLDYVNVQDVFWIGYGFIVLLTTLISLGVFFRPRTFKYLLLKIFKLPFLKKWRASMAEVGDDIIISSKEFKGKKWGYWLQAFGATFFSWTARYWVVNFLMLCFFTVDEHMLVYARQLVMWVIMLISPTPGGSGVAEVAFSGFLGDFIDVTMVGVLAVVWRLMSYYPYLFVGAFILPRWLKRTAK